jgi:hypothetical protein
MRVFLKACNNHYIDFPFSENTTLNNVLAFWKLEGTIYREDVSYGVPAAIPWDSWAFLAVLITEGPVKPGTSFDFLNPTGKPN